MKLSGWGNYPIKNTKVVKPKTVDQLRDALKSNQTIARGNGRSYGDSSVGFYKTVDMKNFNKIISFDYKKGLLVAESGVLLKNIINEILPKGWFPYVTPGTKFVTLGGMIAADVHGKNHHKEGNFSNFVEWIDLVNSDGKVLRCSKKENSEIFEWTIGGMGLTGVIIKAAIKLRAIETSWIKEKTIATSNLDETINLFETYENATYSVAWVDCFQKNKKFFGRSIFTIGEHAKLEDLNKKMKPFNLIKNFNLNIPINLPSWILSGWLLKIFNYFYYLMNKRKKGDNLINWNDYFYPLDKILRWNRLYGQKGFAQFQCVMPQKKSKEGLIEIFETMKKFNTFAYLAVLKKFGPEKGKFSFPMEGYTIALDFPINDKTLQLMNMFDKIISKYGGRIYLAKDSRMNKETLLKTENRLKEFNYFREKINSKKAFVSFQSTRLGM